jgi:RHS repeat-associated protein
MFGTAVYNAPVLGSVGGWRFDFNRELQLVTSDASKATLFLPDGAAYDFVRSGNTFASQATIAAQTRYSVSLVGTPPSDWSTLTGATSQWTIIDSKDQTTWIFATYASITHKFDVGRPISMTKPDGYAQAFSYDANGTLQTISDNRGRSLSVTWDTYAFPTGGNPSTPPTYTMLPVAVKTITLPIGGKLSYVNDLTSGPSGISGIEVPRVLEVDQLDASGSILDKVTYQYESTAYPNFLTGITNALGVRYLTVAYDANGHVVSNGLAGGQNTYTFSYNTPSSSDPNTLTRTVTNPLGKQTVYTWSHSLDGYRTQLQSINGVASTHCPASASSYTYDANGFVASETDAEGRVTAYIRDTRGRPTSITRGSGTAQAVTTTLTWDSTFDIPTQIVAPGLTTTQTVTNGLVTAIQNTDTTTQTIPYSTSGQTRTWTFTYTGGLLTKVDGPLPGTGDLISYTYDANGNFATVTNEMGRVTTVNAVNGFGQPISITDANGINSSLSYDYRGRLSGASLDTANTPSTYAIAYNALGDVSSITDAINARLTFGYDNARRLTSVTNSASEVITYTRDAMGNATSVTIASGANTAFSKTQTFDELGRLIQSVGAVPTNSTYRFGYDRTDNLTRVTDPRSFVFSYGFDALSRLIQEVDQQGATVNLTRNGIDAVTGYQDPRGLTTSYVRNGFGEIIQETSPDKGTSVYVRDARGLVTQRTDPRGTVTTFVYDNAGRLISTSYAGLPALTATFTWDQSAPDNFGLGYLTTIADASGTSARKFDAKGRISADTRTNSPASARPVLYSRDLAGNITSMTYPSGRIVTYARDVLGRISGVTTQQNATAPVVTLASSVAWEPYGGLKGLTFGNGLLASVSRDTDYRITGVHVAPASGPAIIDRTIVWRGDTIVSITDPLDVISSGPATATYAYPGTSNRLASITPVAGAARSFGYDAMGNITNDTRGAGPAMTFDYDVEGRLAHAYQTATPAEGGTYTYDSRWRLASRTMTHASPPSSTTVLYIHDLDDHIIAETDISGNTLREYVWVGDTPLAVVDTVTTSPAIFYVHTDHLMRPLRMTDGSGAVAWEAAYEPFGAVASINAISSSIDLRFPGQWFQLENGLHYNWHRHYDATIGRYLQPDPLGLEALRKDGPTTYNYAGQSPLRKVDPAGLWTIQVGFSGSGTFLGWSFTGFGGLTIDGQGHVGTYYGGGTGAGYGAGLSGGGSFQFSNACSINDLSGLFANVSRGGGWGPNATGDAFYGKGGNGQDVVGGGITIGAGLGSTGFVGATNTSINALR